MVNLLSVIVQLTKHLALNRVSMFFCTSTWSTYFKSGIY